MRLLVCVPWFAPARAFGGTVTAAVATVKGALAAGHDVTVATTDVLDLRSRVPTDAPAEPAGARVVRFPNVSQRLAAANAPLPRGLRSWLRQHVREFDVVLLLDVYSSVSVRYLAQDADPARLHPMPPPLDLPDPGEVPRAPAPTVVYLGQLHPIKRIDVLIDAFAQVRAALREARLEVIGAPSSHGDALRERAARLGLGGSVAFRGLIPEEQKGRALASADVFALLSASEGLPITPLEALACGTPVVLSPGCGLPQVDGVAGIVCDGTAAGAAEALLALLRDPARAQALGEAGRELAAAYRRETVVPELLALLERVATSSSRAA